MGLFVITENEEQKDNEKNIDEQSDEEILTENPKELSLLQIISFLNKECINKDLLLKLIDIKSDELDITIENLEKLEFLKQIKTEDGAVRLELSTSIEAKVLKKANQNKQLKNEMIEKFNLYSKYFDSISNDGIKEFDQFYKHIICFLGNVNLEDLNDKEVYFGFMERVSSYSRNILIDFEQEVSIQTRLLEMKKSYYNKENLSIASTLSKLGLAYYDLGQNEKAIESYEKSFKIYKFDYEVPATEILNGLGQVYTEMDENNKAKEYLENSLELKRKCLADDHPSIALTLNNLGFLYYKFGDFNKSIAYHERALETIENTINDDHYIIGDVNMGLGLGHFGLDQVDKAVEYHIKALNVYTKTLPRNHPSVSKLHYYLGMDYSKKGEFNKAIEYFQSSLKINRKILPYKHKSTVDNYHKLGNVFYELKKYDESIERLEKSLDIAKSILQENHGTVGNIWDDLGKNFKAKGDLGKAIECFENALKIKLKTMAHVDPTVSKLLMNIGEAYLAIGNYEMSIEHFEKALDLRRRNFNESLIGETLTSIGKAYKCMGCNKNAKICYEESIEIYRKFLPSRHPLIKSLNKDLNELKAKSCYIS